MIDQNLKFGWIRIQQGDSKTVDLRCQKDSKDRVVKVLDWNGQELKHNAAARSVFYNGQYWSY
ncbi:hypothetical protein [Acinetobacter bereziniae]|uniref:hypothetical protein n=1 Tax=Acinetobacter bereziniae TaxID=106648 RepID=UPI002575C998|nr:hypothetical protein [Acinetobacter bereziniae]MDM1784249.1 hypothetical protein [Acinetobacter bereziniae]